LFVGNKSKLQLIESIAHALALFEVLSEW